MERTCSNCQCDLSDGRAHWTTNDIALCDGCYGVHPQRPAVRVWRRISTDEFVLTVDETRLNREQALRLAGDILGLASTGDTGVLQCNADAFLRLIEQWRHGTEPACSDGETDKPCDGMQQCANQLEALLRQAI